MLFLKINQSFKLFLIIFILMALYVFKFSFSSDFKDCSNKSFYITNIKSDITSDNISRAKSLAENQARSKAFTRLLQRLSVRQKKKIKFDLDIKNLIDFIKINQEANSLKRFVGIFDVCFNRKAVINFFQSNNLAHAEVYSFPISILPIYGSPRGYVFYDEKHVWHKLWLENLSKYDGLLNFNISKANIALKRNLKPKKIIQAEKNEILKIINFNNRQRLMVVLAEPILLKGGKFALKTSAKLYNANGTFDSTLYLSEKKFKSYESITKIKPEKLNIEIKKILMIFSESWKKNNQFKANTLTHIDLYIPLNKKNDWSNFIYLVKKIPYINEFNIIALTDEVGKVRINFQGSANTFFTILNEKGMRVKKIEDEFVLSKLK